MNRRSLRAAILLVPLALVATSCTTKQTTAVDYRIFGKGTGSIVPVRLDAVETVQEIADGLDAHVWTFGGTMPGPVVRVKVGDTVRFTLTNKSTGRLSHSIDFHAAQTPWDKNYQPVAPGETLTFDFVARFPGAFMYHCGVPPVLHHIANGMVGAIIVEPEEPLPAAREYVLVQNEYYAGAKDAGGVVAPDATAMTEASPTHVLWNGLANRYAASPLSARPGEPIRLWVVNAGPTLTSAFHVIGALFDHVYPDGNPTNALNGIQTWNVPPGGGAMFELSIPDEGLYPFVTHAFAYTGLGAVGVIKIAADAPQAPGSYPAIGNPFDGGVSPASGEVGGDGPAPGPPPGTTPPGTAASTIVARNVAFVPSDIRISAGANVSLVNEDAIPHDLTIDSPSLKVLLDPNQTTQFTFEGSPGTYEFYCSVPGHREAGMTGTLTVVAPG